MTFLPADRMHSNKQRAIHKFGNFTNYNSNTSHEIIPSENFCFVHVTQMYICVCEPHMQLAAIA